MKIQLNGEQYETEANTIGKLLTELEVEPVRVAIELNLKILKKDSCLHEKISEGDQLEIVNFVGGGSGKNEKNQVRKM